MVAKGPHDALRSLNGAVHRCEVNVVYEADIVSFDRIDRKKLKELLERRIADKSLLRLIGKCLHVGVLEGGVQAFPETGTVQGSTLSPFLANVYLHEVLDVWLELEIKPQLKGRAILVRYCDDFVMGFEFQEDAHRLNHLLGERLAEYGLELHSEKTRMLDFRRAPPGQDGGRGPNTFDFLGFTHYWRRSHRGHWHIAVRTQRARMRRTITSIHDGCRRHRHLSIPAQHAALRRKLTGHFNYFAVMSNASSVSSVACHTHEKGQKTLWSEKRMCSNGGS